MIQSSNGQTKRKPLTAEVIAVHWRTLHPGLASRLDRAVALVKHAEHHGNGIWTVRSAGTVYSVFVDTERKTSDCACADSMKRGIRCKHKLAVAIAHVLRQHSNASKGI